jgi:uncharacterized membrane protein YfcA
MAPSELALLAVASLGAGIVNAIAGGGTLLTFPALLFSGMPAVNANATNTVALWPGQLAGALAYTRHLKEERKRALMLAVPSVIGGVLGSGLVLWMPARVFAAAVPWLIIFACALLAVQGPLKRLLLRVPGADHPAALWLVQLAVAIYGGYFGAGMGIVMLAAMGILLPSTVQHANAIKVLLSFLINGSAAVAFIVAGVVAWPQALLMMVGASLGGYFGARLAQRLPPTGMRGVAIAIGLYAAIRILLR